MTVNRAAALVHRLSGVALSLFLPLHFWALGLALQGEARLDGFLRWTDLPVLKIAETLLVVALAAHFAGGLRVLAIEFLAWREWIARTVSLTAFASVAVGLIFALNL